MRKQQTLSVLRRLLGLAMIVAGFFGVAVQLARGGTAARSEQTSSTPALVADAPRVENAKLETRAINSTLDATMRDLSRTAEKPEWVGYRVDQIAGEHGACCNSNWNDGNCGTCRLEKEDGRMDALVCTLQINGWHSCGRDLLEIIWSG